MKLAYIVLIALAISLPAFGQQKELLYTLPPNLPAFPPPGTGLGNFLQPEQGKAVLDLVIQQTPTLDAWKARSAFNRKHIQQGLGLDPYPKRTPLNPIVREKRSYDGYTVENVALESVPGYYTTGNLYRPTAQANSYPIILVAHGHGNLTDPNQGPRLTAGTQQLCGVLARMGAIVFAVDMLGFGDTSAQVPAAVHRSMLAAPIQIWGAMRVLDYLTTLPGADSRRIAVTGASGGGTQAFVLTALDERITISVPVVMVSSYMFGGCPCESGRPIHRSESHFITNAEIAAMAAPRPMLVVSDGADWTQHTPDIEFPFLKKIYALNGVEKDVENVHLKDERHDYGPSKRSAMYKFTAERFGLKHSPEVVDEAKIKVEPGAVLRVFTDTTPLPPTALQGAEAIEASLNKQQQ